ncbi:polysaccharide deacetylase family protein [Natranaerofaba carboxydovora]|uniref:polysaccharide deacetylase family protein n=1 Tax=Natranaerofaba carboxydovora TaxID=2742683 RepID=UPI001F139080|nr:polysaccharide deacetylase family protein [Natranaerofaba carboxydovora]UMZ73865.1 Peptidoglycan-N-acetylglucosamine deacetylase [Natranaerofaba carboxydovora]
MKLLTFILAFFVIFVPMSGEVSALQLHRVEAGETLFEISNQYDVNSEELSELNLLKDVNLVYDGQALLIPKEGEDTHVVSEGDTLNNIASHYGFSIEELTEINDIEDSDVIYIDQEITLPRIVTMPPHISASSSGTSNSLETVETNEIKDTKVVNDEADIEDNVISTTQGLLSLYPDNFYQRGSTGEKKVALTFDDGPDSKYTPQILEILDEYDVPATFYYVGQNIESYPDVLKDTVDRGHEVGNHSWSHPNLRYLPEDEFEKEIDKTSDIIKEYTGEEAATLRPPYGDLDIDNMPYLVEENYNVVNWSIDTWDWWNMDSDKILINVLKDLHPDSIILLHSAGSSEGYQSTVDALPEIIYNLKVRGYDFVTVSEII